MSRLEFTGEVQQSTEETARERRRQNGARSVDLARVSASTVLVTAIAVVVLVVLDQPIIRIDSRELSLVSSEITETSETSVVITGAVGERLRARGIRAINLRVNEFDHVVTVNNGAFQSRVPLVNGPNTIQAVFGNVASKPITVVAKLPRYDLWVELTWDGPGDIDLHLYLPNGEHCSYRNKTTSAGATLDFDNTDRDGPEHIRMEKAIAGQYRLTIYYFALKGRDPAVPVNSRILLKLKDGRIVRAFNRVLRQQDEEVTVDEFTF